MGKSGGRRVVDPTTKTKTKYKGKKKNIREEFLSSPTLIRRSISRLNFIIRLNN
jgi:hypothetical protein